MGPICATLGAVVAAGCVVGGELGEPCSPGGEAGAVICGPQLACERPPGESEPRCYLRCASTSECAPTELCWGSGCWAAPGDTALGGRCVSSEECSGRALCTLGLLETTCEPYCGDGSRCPVGRECAHEWCSPPCTPTGATACDDRLSDHVCDPWSGCVPALSAATCAGDRTPSCELGLVCAPDRACLTEEDAQRIAGGATP